MVRRWPWRRWPRRLVELVGRAKYEAWVAGRGMSRDEAMAAYSARVAELATRYPWSEHRVCSIIRRHHGCRVVVPPHSQTDGQASGGNAAQ